MAQKDDVPANLITDEELFANEFFELDSDEELQLVPIEPVLVELSSDLGLEVGSGLDAIPPEQEQEPSQELVSIEELVSAEELVAEQEQVPAPKVVQLDPSMLIRRVERRFGGIPTKLNLPLPTRAIPFPLTRDRLRMRCFAPIPLDFCRAIIWRNPRRVYCVRVTPPWPLSWEERVALIAVVPHPRRPHRVTRLRFITFTPDWVLQSWYFNWMRAWNCPNNDFAVVYAEDTVVAYVLVGNHGWLKGRRLIFTPDEMELHDVFFKDRDTE